MTQDTTVEVLFVCVHNAGRSVMAEALFNSIAPPGMRARSAGTQPAGGPHPEVVAVMDELGTDVSAHRGEPLTDESVAAATRVITMGCAVDAQACPALRYAALEDWGLHDPKGQPLEAVRATRDEIGRRVAALVAELTA